ncbi:CHAT domain-containing protein [Truncatella angustata]|uniref:CHAT domain-containing protein n=1 Tax=Truncatella angustata TaxID=152316 RepID=A0A9P8UFD2_9PEZI|nr:CHAT domain-containing protein [Truncatella angustata]KAH6648897.1 CHAT domain-containing protein [Truncatella angustata]
MARQAVDLTPIDHANRAWQLGGLGSKLHSRYKRTGETEDLQEALQIARQALDLTPVDHPARAGQLDNLERTLSSQYKRTGKTEDLQEAIQIARQALGLTPNDHPARAWRLGNLGNRLYSRHKRTGEMADLQEAIQMARQAVNLLPDGHLDRARRSGNLGNMLQERYEQTGEMADLQEAIQLAQQAVDITPIVYTERTGHLNNLGNKLLDRFDRIGEIADLQKAIHMAQQAIDLAPIDHPERANWLNNAAIMLGVRCKRTGKMADLQEAIQMARQAIDLTPNDHPEKAQRLNNFVYLLQINYKSTGETEDLQEAIQIMQQVVDLTPITHPDRARRLNNLADTFTTRYERTGEITDLYEAIDMLRLAIPIMPIDHPQRLIILNNLGNMLHQRYRYTGEMADLQEAIKLVQKAVHAKTTGHFNMVLWLSDLGVMLNDRYNRTNKEEDLEEAINTTQQALELIPTDHPQRAQILGRLGNKLMSRYHRKGEVASLQEAIEKGQQAVDLTSTNHSEKAEWLSCLGDQLHSRYKRTGQMTDIQKAIESAQQAVDLTPTDHPSRSGRLISLGNKLARRYRHIGVMADLDRARSSFREAWRLKTAVPLVRIDAGVHALQLIDEKDFDTAVELGKEIIDFLPVVHTKLRDRNDQQYVISAFAGVAATLCSLLLQSGQVPDALQYLEKGRAVIIGRLIDDQSDLQGLQQRDVAYAYRKLRDEVNTPVRIVEDSLLQKRMQTRRVEAIAELETCIQNIRRIRGHERFLLGQEITEMQKCATGGNIVIVNMSRIRSDAIIVSPTTIKALHLPRFQLSELQRWLSNKWGKSRDVLPKINQWFLRYLSWLWDASVQPILDEIGISASTNSLPRIWWIGTGFASSVPFHAAGNHAVGSTDNTLSRAISSYIPSIKSLSFAKRKIELAKKAQGPLLVVTMPTTPGNSPLRGVEKELHQLIKTVDGRLPIKHLNLPTAQDVIDNLPDCCIAHFACHGSTNVSDPSRSGLDLQNGHQSERLTVQAVSELHLRNAKLAYLSACSTAVNHAPRLTDEVIHVVSGFQTAGFPHVIGCLWPANDRACSEMAESFYRLLLQEDGVSSSNWEVALLLRDAVMETREKNMKSPLFWAPFVHFGV